MWEGGAIGGALSFRLQTQWCHFKLLYQSQGIQLLASFLVSWSIHSVNNQGKVTVPCHSLTTFVFNQTSFEEICAFSYSVNDWSSVLGLVAHMHMRFIVGGSSLLGCCMPDVQDQTSSSSTDHSILSLIQLKKFLNCHLSSKFKFSVTLSDTIDIIHLQPSLPKNMLKVTQILLYYWLL